MGKPIKGGDVIDFSRVEEIDIFQGRFLVRIEGELREASTEQEGLKELYLNLIADKQETDRETQDFIYSWRDARWRVQKFSEVQSGTGVCLRKLPDVPPCLKDIGFEHPEELYSLLSGPGLVLICGPSASGKTTTLAALVRYLRERPRRGKVVTIEDPVEYLHDDPFVFHRAVGVNVPTFRQGIIEAMRQSPEVIVVGEIRDVDAAEAAIDAGTTGHLVLATLHATDVSNAILRMLGLLDDRHDDMMADALAGIHAQYLIRDKGRAFPIYENLKVTSSVSAMLRSDLGNLSQLPHQFYTQKRLTLRERAKQWASRPEMNIELLERWLD